MDYQIIYIDLQTFSLEKHKKTEDPWPSQGAAPKSSRFMSLHLGRKGLSQVKIRDIVTCLCNLTWVLINYPTSDL